jgi:hypothetical protein
MDQDGLRRPSTLLVLFDAMQLTGERALGAGQRRL